MDICNSTQREREYRREPLGRSVSLHRLARGKTQGAKCPSVERSCEAEKTVFSRMPLCKLHRGLNSLGPAITKKHFLLKVPWSYLDQFLRQLNNFFIIEVGP